MRVERPRGNLDIAGVVSDERGPVAGAVVVALAHVKPAPGCDAAALGAQHEANPDDEQPLAQATTDAAGAFVLGGLTAGDYAVWAQAGERTALRAPVAAGARAALALEAGIAFEGRVVDGKRKPLPGAHLKLLRCGQARAFETDSDASGAFHFEPVPRGDHVLWTTLAGFVSDARDVKERHLRITLERPLALTGTVRRGASAVAGATVRITGAHPQQTVSDAHGAFSFGALPPAHYGLEAEQGGDVATDVVELSWLQHSPALLQLEPGATLRGDVTEEGGAPLAGATVKWVGKTTQTDARGAFSFTGLSAGEDLLQVAVAHHLDPQQHQVKLAAGATVEVHLELPRAAPLRGHVFDEQHHPIEGASVMAIPEHGDSSDHATTDASGAFALDALPAGAAGLTVLHDDFAELLADATAPADDVVLVMKAGLAIRGKVLDERGAPAPDVTVDAMVEARHHRLRKERGAQTDAKGTFALRGLTAGAYVLLASDPESEARQAQAPVTLDAHDVEVELHLKTTPAIRGRVLDGEGAPVDGAEVTAAASNHPPRHAAADADGHFEIVGLDDLDYDLRAGHPDFLRGDAVTAHTGATVELRLTRLGRAKGRAVHPDGTPVVLYELNGRTIDDPAGAFEQGGRNELELDFKLDGVTTHRTVPVKPGEIVQVPDVVLGATRTILGKVVDSVTHVPVAGARVWLTQGDSFTTQADGHFELRAELGPVTLEAERDGYVPTTLPVSPSPSNVEIALAPTGSIEGTLTDAQGRPFGRQLSVHATGARTSEEPDAQHLAGAHVEPSGHFLIAGLAPGSFLVSVSGAVPPAIAPKQVTVEAGATAHVDLREPAGGAEIDVTLANADRLSVHLVPGAPALPTTQTELMQALHPALRLTATESGIGFQKVQAGHYTLLCITNGEAHRGVFALPVDSDGATPQRITVTVPAQVQPLDR